MTQGTSTAANPADPIDALDDEEDLGALDPLMLSALLSSRVCHDLINPIGAIGSGIEVLDDPSVDDGMQDAAFDLIRTGAHKALALLKFARLAYGAAGGFGAQIKIDDARDALEGYYEAAKPSLDWRIEGDLAAKEIVKTMLIVGCAAADSAPRGGDVVIDGDLKRFTITARGKKLFLNDDLIRALDGDARDIAPKYTPALIASQIVYETGGFISAAISDEEVVFTVEFGDEEDALGSVR
ncbi:MAG: histidine phosphotransferase family protein [Pseudomonadota bacterium]